MPGVVWTGLAAALVGAVAACGGPPAYPNTWIALSPTAAVLVQWTQTGGRLSGQLVAVTLAGTTTQPLSVLVTGQVNAQGAVTLTLGSSTETGSVSSTRLTLNGPDATGLLTSLVLIPGRVARYRAAVASLRQRAAAALAAAQAAQAAAAHQQALNQQVVSANTALSADLGSYAADTGTVRGDASTLQGDVSTLVSDRQAMQQDLQTEQSDATTDGCANGGYGAVQADASTVDTDLSTMGTDLTTLSGDLSSMRQDMAALAQDVRTIQHDWSALQDAVTADPADTPAAKVTERQVTTALTAIRHSMAEANAAITAEQAQAASLYRSGQALDAQAHAVLTNMGCAA